MQERKNKTSDSQKKAVKKYLSKFVDVKIRVTAEDPANCRSREKPLAPSFHTAECALRRSVDQTHKCRD